MSGAITALEALSIGCFCYKAITKACCKEKSFLLFCMSEALND